MPYEHTHAGVPRANQLHTCICRSHQILTKSEGLLFHAHSGDLMHKALQAHAKQITNTALIRRKQK